MLVPCWPPNRPGFEPLEMLTDERDFAAIERLLKEHRPKIAIEVGSWVGATSLLLAEYCERVFCVDHFSGSADDLTEGYVRRAGGSYRVFRTFCENVGIHLFTKAFPVIGESGHIASLWPAHLPADAIYLDGGHHFEEISGDIAAWRKHVRKGGILAGHDYSPQFPGVMRAVDEIGKDGVEGAVWWKRL
jgi:hypothetical protein